MAKEDGVLWISGDTMLYDGVRQVADHLQINTALLHLGGVRFPITGPVRYSMTARDAVELCRLISPRTAIPIHYEGWKHFQQGRDEIEREFALAPEDIRRRIRWLPVGAEVEIAARVMLDGAGCLGRVVWPSPGGPRVRRTWRFSRSQRGDPSLSWRECTLTMRSERQPGATHGKGLACLSRF